MDRGRRTENNGGHVRANVSKQKLYIRSTGNFLGNMLFVRQTELNEVCSLANYTCLASTVITFLECLVQLIIKMVIL